MSTKYNILIINILKFIFIILFYSFLFFFLSALILFIFFIRIAKKFDKEDKILSIIFVLFNIVVLIILSLSFVLWYRGVIANMSFGYVIYNIIRVEWMYLTPIWVLFLMIGILKLIRIDKKLKERKNHIKVN